MHDLRFMLRLSLTLLWLLWLLPLALVCQALALKGVKHRIIRCYWSGVTKFWGLRITQQGTFLRQGPALLVSNHASYTDIPVLGSLSPMIFIPKAEISTWPMVGALCRLCDVVFVERRASKTGEYKDVLRRRLEEGELLCLFPEGTTSDNSGLLPFKSAFFSIIEQEVNGQPVPIQPVIIRYTHLNRKPVTQTNREEIAWIGDAELLPHIRRLLGKHRSIDVTVTCMPALTLAPGSDRKALAAQCREIMLAQFTA